MGLSLITDATTEPVTLAEAKQHCRIDTTDDDGLIAGYIMAARSYIEGQIHRPICSKLYEYTLDGGWPCKNGRTIIELPMPPLRAVRSVAYVDESGTEQTLSDSQYVAITDKPKGAIVPSYDASWPSVRNQYGAVSIRYIAGYTSFTDSTTSPISSVTGPGVPDELRQAILMLISHWNENRETVNVGNITSELPFTVEALISPFRSMTL
jgi:uncharacterized phiE125 gp8 family phage protein